MTAPKNQRGSPEDQPSGAKKRRHAAVYLRPTCRGIKIRQRAINAQSDELTAAIARHSWGTFPNAKQQAVHVFLCVHIIEM